MPTLREVLGLANKPKHYYGDTVRAIYVAIGLIMLASLPFFEHIIPFPISLSILSVIVLAIVAGVTNPVQKFTAVLNIFVSILGFSIFEYFSIKGFHGQKIFLFLVNEIIALLFFLTLYLGIKTLRGFLLKEKEN